MSKTQTTTTRELSPDESRFLGILQREITSDRVTFIVEDTQLSIAIDEVIEWSVLFDRVDSSNNLAWFLVYQTRARTPAHTG